MRVRLDQVNVVVRDMEAMSDFYRRVGLQIDAPSAEWAAHERSNGGAGVDFDLDSQEFAQMRNEGWPGGPGVVLTFRVEPRERQLRGADEPCRRDLRNGAALASLRLTSGESIPKTAAPG